MGPPMWWLWLQNLQFLSTGGPWGRENLRFVPSLDKEVLPKGWKARLSQPKH